MNKLGTTCLLEACVELLGYRPKGMTKIIKDNKGFPVKDFKWLEDIAAVKVLGAGDQATYLRPGSKVIIVTEAVTGRLHAACVSADAIPVENEYAYGIYRLEDYAEE